MKRYDVKEMDALRIAFAEALWTWADTEAELFTVYMVAITDGSGKFNSALHHSFFAVVSAKSRLDMTHAAAKQAWDGTTLSEWNALYERYRSALTKRGSIAHLSGLPTEPNAPSLKTKCLLLEPVVHSKFPWTPAEQHSNGIGVPQLEEMTQKWKKLEDDMKTFSDRFLLRHMSEAQRKAYAGQ